MRRVLVMAGIVAPLLFSVVVILAGFLRPGYDPIRRTISELAVQSQGRIQTLNFIVFGVLLIAFGMGLPGGVLNHRKATLLGWLIGLWGVGFILIAFTPIGPSLSARRLHYGVLDGLGLLFPMICLIAAVMLWREPAWHKMAVFSLVVGGFGVLVAVSWIKWSKLILRSRNLGLYERLVILIALIWIEVLAMKLLNRHYVDSHPQPP